MLTTKKVYHSIALLLQGIHFKDEIRTTQNIETVHLKQSLQLVPNDLLNSDPYSTLVARNSIANIYKSNI